MTDLTAEKNQIGHALILLNRAQNALDDYRAAMQDLHAVLGAAPEGAIAAQRVILIDGSSHYWYRPTITYDELVLLDGKGPERMWTVVYKRPDSNPTSGIMHKGSDVPVTDRMRFSIADTSNA